MDPEARAANIARLKQIIAEFGGQTELARRAGYSQPTIYRVAQTGRVTPELAIALAKATGVPRSEWRPDLWRAHRMAKADVAEAS